MIFTLKLLINKQSIFLNLLTNLEVVRIIKSLKNKKSVGKYEVPVVLKEVAIL